MITRHDKKIYLLECLRQYFRIFDDGASVLDCATWMNCSKPTALKYLSELIAIDKVKFIEYGNKRLFYPKNTHTSGVERFIYESVRKELKGF